MPAAFAAPRLTSRTASEKQDTALEPSKHKLGAVKHKPSRPRHERSLGGFIRWSEAVTIESDHKLWPKKLAAAVEPDFAVPESGHREGERRSYNSVR